MAKILIVEDDDHLSDILRQWLLSLNHVVEQIFDGATASDYLRAYQYDLVILDWNLPGVSGPELCRQIKRQASETAVIMLTAKTSTQDKVQGFDAGADEYMTKPVQFEEFSARIRAHVRRSGTASTKRMSHRDLTLEPEAGKATRGARQFSLPPKELELLELLMQNPNQFFTTEALIDRFWGPQGSRASLANCMKRLRAQLTQPGEEDLIETVQGLGYRLK